jgi:hypothetical protein
MKIRDDLRATLGDNFRNLDKRCRLAATNIRAPSLNKVVKNTRIPTGSCQGNGNLYTRSVGLAIF